MHMPGPSSLEARRRHPDLFRLQGVIMTETPVGTQTFNAKFEQRDVLPGGTVLAMRLSFMPDAQSSWTAEGHGWVVRGSTPPPLDLQFPLRGTLGLDTVEPIEPPVY